MSLLRGNSDQFFRRLRQASKQKSRINEDPAEFDWKCLLGL